MPYGQGIGPFVPFPTALPVPSEGLFDEPQRSITININWMLYLASAAVALAADSTWAATSKSELLQVVDTANQLIQYLGNPDLPIVLKFQKKPGQEVDWQFSIDDGATWADGPLCAVEFSPTFPVDIAAPAGYDLSVNSGLSQAPIPLLTAHDPNAVVNDPLTSLVNVVSPAINITALSLTAQGASVPLVLESGIEAAEGLLTLVAAL